MSAENSDKTAKKVIGRPFQPGESGNPGGRPKSSIYADAVRKVLSQELPADLRANEQDKRTFAEAIAEQIARMALAGNLSAAQELANRSDGTPVSSTANGGTGLTIADDVFAGVSATPN